jgi:trans-AT polyketide synthase/acyltransferase/oxidoreductase domain-containing protein
MLDADLDLLPAVLRAYGPSRCSLERLGREPALADGPGRGLEGAVERHGVGPLVAALVPGDRLVLADEGIELELVREADGALLRARWFDGPAYEERLPAGVSSLERLLGLPVAEPAPAGAVARPVVSHPPPLAPRASPTSLPLEGAALVEALHDPARPLWALGGRVYPSPVDGGSPIPVVTAGALGSRDFCAAHGLRAPYIAGAMAGGIASVELVVAMGKAGLVGFFGAGGLDLPAVAAAVDRIQAALGPTAPAGFNLLHNPAEPSVEEATVDLYLSRRCRMVSASAYMGLTPAVVRYRLSGLHRGPSGELVVPNKVFAKVSRLEVAERFMRPAPKAMIAELLAAGRISTAEAELAPLVPLAEDITAEADSGGHTDHRPLVVLLPAFLRLRDRVSAEEGYAARGLSLRVGGAGGLGDPASVHAAFAMGADYVLTGSVNQACVEAGTSAVAKAMVAASGIADCTTGPAPDMFEIGAHVQVLGAGTMYAQRAQRLYDLYRRHRSLEEISEEDRKKVESTILRRSFDEVWADTRAYWAARDAREVERAEADPHHRMALVFRWYLGMTSRWARIGDAERKRDFQIWCGPAAGLFNDWVKGSALEPVEGRTVVGVADALLTGAAALRRVEVARALGVALPPGASSPRPRLG